jgi:hypothetical protein
VLHSPGYRTWRETAHYGAECLLCGTWTNGHKTRGEATIWATRVHPTWCHVITGCHCPEPHLTAAMAARIGVKDSYPRAEAATLFRMAAGVRKYRPPGGNGNSGGFGPEFGSGGYEWTR